MPVYILCGQTLSHKWLEAYLQETIWLFSNKSKKLYFKVTYCVT